MSGKCPDCPHQDHETHDAWSKANILANRVIELEGLLNAAIDNRRIADSIIEKQSVELAAEKYTQGMVEQAHKEGAEAMREMAAKTAEGPLPYGCTARATAYGPTCDHKDTLFNKKACTAAQIRALPLDAA